MAQQINSVNYDTKRIYLHLDTVANGFDAILAYFEVCKLACRNGHGEQNRKNPYLGAEGHIYKTTVANIDRFTPRFGYLDSGWMYVPYSGETHTLSLACEIVSIDGVLDADAFDLGGLGVNVNIISDYAQNEIIQVTIIESALTEEEHDLLVAIPTAEENAEFLYDNLIECPL